MISLRFNKQLSTPQLIVISQTLNYRLSAMNCLAPYKPRSAPPAIDVKFDKRTSLSRPAKKLYYTAEFSDVREKGQNTNAIRIDLLVNR